MLKEVFIHKVEKGAGGKFIKPASKITYTRGDKLGLQREWEFDEGAMDTVHILINKIDSKEILFAKQVRPPVLVKHPETNGITIEAVAGMVDKYPDILDTLLRAKLNALMEVKEEAGYTVTIEDLDVLPTTISGTGTNGSTCHHYYCEVTGTQFSGQQLEPSEDIEVLAIPYEELRFFLQTCKTTDNTTRQLVQWFILEYGSIW